MFETPYQTPPCRNFDMAKTISTIRKLEINEELIPAEGSLRGVMLVPPGVVDMLPFAQPLTKLEAPTLNANAVIDGRSLLRLDGKPSKEDTYKHAIMAADLTVMWYQDGLSFRKDMLNLGEFPAKVYISWMGTSVAQKLLLDFGQSSLFRALVAVYYIQLFNPLPKEPSVDDLDKLIVRASRYVPGVDSMTLAGILGDIPRLDNLKDFVDWAKKRIDSPRMDNLSVSFVYTALGFSFGAQYQEAAAIACEYPPTFMALLYKTVAEHSYTRTTLGKVVERTVSKGNDKDFLKDMNHLIGKR